MTREEAIRILGYIPTIGEQVDAIELAIEALQKPSIVRCGECKHHGMDNCPMWGGSTTEDYMWCCDGERRE